MKAKLIGISSKIKHINTWENVYVDPYTIDGQDFIKVFVTQYDLKHKHFNLHGGFILLGDETYRIEDVWFEEKRPKYAHYRVSVVEEVVA